MNDDEVSFGGNSAQSRTDFGFTKCYMFYVLREVCILGEFVFCVSICYSAHALFM